MTGRKQRKQTGNWGAFKVFTQEYPQHCRLHIEKGNNCTKEWRKSHTYETQRLLFALLESFTAREGKNNGDCGRSVHSLSPAQCIRRRAADDASHQTKSGQTGFLPSKCTFKAKRLSPGGDNPASIHLASHSISQGSARRNNFEEIQVV